MKIGQIGGMLLLLIILAIIFLIYETVSTISAAATSAEQTVTNSSNALAAWAPANLLQTALNDIAGWLGGGTNTPAPATASTPASQNYDTVFGTN
jgi:hypothetical protein